MLVSQEGLCSMEVYLILEVLALLPDHENIPGFTEHILFSRFHVMKI
jgi:hypothetical protein